MNLVCMCGVYVCAVWTFSVGVPIQDIHAYEYVKVSSQFFKITIIYFLSVCAHVYTHATAHVWK